MPYTSPATQTAGAVAAASWANSIKAATDFLANPPACRVYHTANQSIPNSTESTVAFNSERYDTDSMHSTVTNNSRITITTAGLYAVSVSLQFGVDTDYTVAYAVLRVNGSTQIAYGGVGTWSAALVGPLVSVGTISKFAAGDYVEVRVLQANASAGANNIIASAQGSPEFSACWLGLG